MIRTPFNDAWMVRTETTGLTVGPVSLPYDAMIHETRDPATLNGANTGYFPGGTYTYSKQFHAPQHWRDQAVQLEFEGVYRHSEVFLNGTKIGGRPSGYALFRVDLNHTALRLGEQNLLEVVAHNAAEQNSRWYTGSGIYRPVHLLTGPSIRIAPTGLRLTTQAITPDTAIVHLTVDVVNDTREAADITLRIDITDTDTDTDGKCVASIEQNLRVAPSGPSSTMIAVTVPSPRAWSPEDPHLYTARATLTVDQATVDQATERFGVRTIAVDAHHGLRINNDTVKLRGACIHHDNGVIGAVELPAAAERRIRILRDSGYNAIRSSHNPTSRAVLDACDRLGMLVIDELTDVWYKTKLPNDYALDFDANWEQDLEAMIEVDVNHPSVIMYSIGNEIAATATADGLQTGARLAERARHLDPSRPLTNSINGFLNLITPAKARRKPAAPAENTSLTPGTGAIAILNATMTTLEAITPYLVRLPAVDRKTRDAWGQVEVAGYNYMHSRYLADTTRHPRRVILGSETTSAQVVRYWRQIETMPNVIGDFVWTGWDYLGEAGIAVIAYGEHRRFFQPFPGLTAGTPIIDITGHRLPQSYLNEIVWRRRTAPYLAVLPPDVYGSRPTTTNWRDSTAIHSWSWEGYEGQPTRVEVYADAARVDLFLDGQPVDTRREVGQTSGFRADFTVPYQPGELTAIAYDAAGREIGRDTLQSAGPDLHLDVTVDHDILPGDGTGLAHVTIELTDGAGNIRPLADRPLTVHVDGVAQLVGLGNGNPMNPDGFGSGTSRSYQGRALAVVRAGTRPGGATVHVSADGCAPKTLALTVTETAPDPAAETDLSPAR